jgi:RecB family exonuclease
MNIHHLSASSISAFRECPMAFYGRYLYGWTWVAPAMQAQAMALGSAVHKALEAHHTGQDAITALCQHWGTIDVPMPADAFAKALGLIRCYTADEGHDPRDVVEREFWLNIPGIPVPFTGRIDLQRGPLLFRDYKTTGSKTWWTQERVDADIQLTIYALFLSGECRGAQATGELHVLRHGEKFEHEVFVTTRNKAEQKEGQDSIRETWEVIQKGELNAICKPGKCRYPTRCREFGYVGTDSQELVVAGR